MIPLGACSLFSSRATCFLAKQRAPRGTLIRWRGIVVAMDLGHGPSSSNIGTGFMKCCDQPPYMHVLLALQACDMHDPGGLTTSS